MVRVSTVGIDVPADFPHQPYEAIQARLRVVSQTADQTFHLSGAWNAVAYRFVSCAEASDRFIQLMAAGTMPPQPERFRQEESLFNFFVNGLAEIESFFYAVYWIGSLAEPARFPIVTGSGLRNIQPDSTMNAISAGQCSNLFSAAFGRLRGQPGSGAPANTPDYEEWKDVRNILAHRACYGRIANLSGQPTGDVWRVRDLVLDAQLTASRRSWLAETMKQLLDSTEAYVNAIP